MSELNKSPLSESGHSGYVNKAAEVFARHNGGQLPKEDIGADQEAYARTQDALITAGETPYPDYYGRRFDIASVIHHSSDGLSGITRDNIFMATEGSLRVDPWPGNLNIRFARSEQTLLGPNSVTNIPRSHYEISPHMEAKLRAQTALRVLDEAARMAEGGIPAHRAVAEAVQSTSYDPYFSSLIGPGDRQQQALALASDVRQVQEIISAWRNDSAGKPLPDLNEGDLLPDRNLRAGRVIGLRSGNRVLTIGDKNLNVTKEGLFESVVSNLLSTLKPESGADPKDVMHFKQNAMTLAAALEYASQPTVNPETLIDAAMEKAGQQMGVALSQVSQNAATMFRNSQTLLERVAAGAIRTTKIDRTEIERDFALGEDKKGLKTEQIRRVVTTTDNLPERVHASAGTVKANISTSPVITHTSRIAAVPLTDDYGVMGRPDVHADASGAEASISGGPGAIFAEITFVNMGPASVQIEINGPAISR